MKIIKGLVYTDKQYIELLENKIEEIKSQKEICDKLLETTHIINDNLQQRIDKAIKYLKLKVDIPKNHLEEAIKDREEDLLKILKGEE